MSDLLTTPFRQQRRYRICSGQSECSLHSDRIINDRTIDNYANLRSMLSINTLGLVDFNLFSECVYTQMIVAHL